MTDLGMMHVSSKASGASFAVSVRVEFYGGSRTSRAVLELEDGEGGVCFINIITMKPCPRSTFLRCSKTFHNVSYTC